MMTESTLHDAGEERRLSEVLDDNDEFLRFCDNSFIRRHVAYPTSWFC